MLSAILATVYAGTGPSGSQADATIRMEVRDGRGIIAVTVNGQGPYRFGVETGSRHVLVSAKLVKALALRPAELGFRSTFRLDSLRMGSVVVRGLSVVQSDLRMLRVDGLLGLEAYTDLLATVDYPNQQFRLTHGKLPEPDGRDVLQAVPVGPLIGVEVNIAGLHEIGVIDTQAGLAFQVLPVVADELRFAEPLAGVGHAFVGGGAPVEVKEGRLAGELRIGRHVFDHPRIAVHPLPPSIPSLVTIGIDALRHFAITIDQRSMAVRFERPDTAAIEE